MSSKNRTVILLIVTVALVCAGQRPGSRGGPDSQIGNTQSLAKPAVSSACRDARLFEDPSTHLRWMRLQDPTHPAGPAELVPLPAGKSIQGQVCAVIGHVSHRLDRPLPVIHATEAVVVEQQTPVSMVRLQATALASARAGDSLRVRLKSNQQVLLVIADGPHHARLPVGKEAQW
jgi:hypothetical protein